MSGNPALGAKQRIGALGPRGTTPFASSDFDPAFRSAEFASDLLPLDLPVSDAAQVKDHGAGKPPRAALM